MKKFKKIYPYLIIFIIFLIITTLTPIAGDDWGNYLEGTLGIRHMIGQAIGMYFDWEGRFISRLLINFLTYYKVLWNIINSLLITSIIYLIVQITNSKSKKQSLLFAILIVLLMNIHTFGQVVTWLAGNITYLFVIPLLLFYFNYILHHQNNNKKTIIALTFLNIIMTMFVEHMAVILVTGNILILLSRYIKTKKIDKEILIYTIASTLGLITMLFSPGSRKRSLTENITFNELNIIEKILYNVPNFIYYTFTVNYTLSIIMTLGNYYLVKRQIKNKKLRLLSYLYLLIFPIINSLIYLYSSLLNKDIIVHNNIIVILYFISYILIDLLLVYKATKKDKINKTLFFYLLGYGANVIMTVSPTWGYRTSFATYIFLSISYLLIINRYMKETKIINFLATTICILSSIFYITLYTSARLQLIENNKNIKEQLEEDKDVIEIIKYPNFVSCNINPENDYHLQKFKLYYEIPEDKEVKLIDNNWKYQLIYTKKED